MLAPGLTSLQALFTLYTPYSTMPNLDDLTALFQWYSAGAFLVPSPWTMNETESNTKFNGLVSINTVYAACAAPCPGRAGARRAALCRARAPWHGPVAWPCATAGRPFAARLHTCESCAHR